MTSLDTLRELQNMQDLLSRADLALDTRPLTIGRTTNGHHRVTWKAIRPDTDLFHGPFATISAYRAWLNAGAYTLVLFDGSFLQITYDLDRERVVGHRLAYYPPPFDFDLNLLREEPLLDLLDLYSESRESVVHLRSPIRFDFDPFAQSPEHPASHLTINSHDCRWALASPLSPGQFLRFVFRHFYASLWPALDFIRAWPEEFYDRTITPSEESFLHISWQRPVPPSLTP